MAERHWYGTTEDLGEKPVPVLFFNIISHGLTRASAERGQRFKNPLFT